MKLPSINRRQAAAILLVAAALMLLDSFYQVAMHIRWRCWIPASLAAEAPSTQPSTAQPAVSQPASVGAASQATSQPTSTQAAASQAAVTGPVGTRSAATQAGSSQPAASQPADKVRDARKADGPPDTSSAPKPPKPHELAAAIKKRNIMAEPKPTGHGLSLTGVLDNVAFFRNREGKDVSIEEGKSGEGGVKVTTIEGTNVTIDYEGKPETMRMFPASPEPPSGGRPESAGRGESGRSGPPGTESAAPRKIAPGSASQSATSPAESKESLQSKAAGSQQVSTR